MAKMTCLLYLSCCFIISLYIGNVLCKVNDACTGIDSSSCGTDSTLYVCVDDKCQCSDLSHSITGICTKYLDPPTNVQLTDPKINSLKVTWTKPGNIVNANYVLHLFDRKDLSEPPAFPDEEKNVFLEDVNVEEYVFHNLTSFWEYKASVQLINTDTNRISKQAFSGVEKTLESAPGLIDDIIRLSTISTINVTWSCLKEKRRHGIITQYVLTYEVTDSNNKTTVTKEASDGIDCKYFVNIPVLPKTYYTVYIRADTDANEGEVLELKPYLTLDINKSDSLVPMLLGILGGLFVTVLLV